ncbi:MAG: hypothetical protein IKS42_10205 [Oscillospiraceae bacterium]|nr:hypothetical protein [Oscillospiraceae bacterium]
MKTFFKRTAAAATGSVLVLTQLAATAVINTSAAESKTWDKAWVISVPVEETLKSTEVVEGDTVKEITSSVVAGESQWNNDFEAAILAIAGGDSATATSGVSAVKTTVKNLLAGTPYADAETAQAIADAISSTAVAKIADGKTVVTVDVAECGTAVGAMIETAMRRAGCKMLDDAGNPIVVDWSAFKVSGTVTAEVTYTYDKNISYKVSFTDETGTTYTASDAGTYAEKKYQEAAAVISASATKYAANGITKFTKEMTQFETYAKNGMAKVKKTVTAMYGVSLTGTDLEATYADYLAAETAAVGKRVAKQIEKRAPKTLNNALYNAKASDVIGSAISAFQQSAGSNVTVNLAAADLADILTSGSDYTISIPNGASADVSFSIADDQNAALLAALQGIDATVETVESHKEVTVNVDNKLDGTGNFYYNVVRVIDKITKKTIETESTESTESTETQTETQSTETQTESTETQTESTETQTETQSTESSTDSTETETQTTAASYSIEIAANGAELPEQVYWSEEEVNFNLDGLKVALKIFKNGEQIAEADVTKAFSPIATCAADFEFVGFGKYDVEYQLTDLTVVQKAITDNGANIEDLGASAPTMGMKISGAPAVWLVLRGDMDLNNKVDILDAQAAMVYYGDQNASLSPANTLEFLSNLSDEVALLVYEHYAADVYDGNGQIRVQDVQSIMSYYGENTVAQRVTAWDTIIGTDVTVQSELHFDPLKNDTICKEFVEANK